MIILCINLKLLSLFSCINELQFLSMLFDFFIRKTILMIYYNVFCSKKLQECHASMSFNSNKDGCGKKHATSCSAVLLLLLMLVFLLQYILGHTYWMHGITANSKKARAVIFSPYLYLYPFFHSVLLSLYILLTLV